MKNILSIVLMLCFGLAFAQNSDTIKPKYEKKGNLTEATYYYDNGVVKQHGFFNKAGELHGTWSSFDLQGNKLAVGKYENGTKVGKWFFWTEDTLKEVDFVDSRMATVNEWKNSSTIAIRD
ncbi:toxin-antitoxin system YwqK family antitoxin [Mangrovimonas spongiae]|uniref:Nicotinic acid mononucleotide adenyltransferase n=1 Tax=Mangrovimonas spongiae TaxID=2494697 RepID=A0A428K036_9FLAO|nr:nicotinic acid mononucleotide adenyltransferase [Mangrovimonas spongiae]RSK39718.1 nicotinic acid mononucleotide adenyltransferase [Mangrovimonas spongiae]